MDFKVTKGLKKDKDFRTVYNRGKSFSNKYLVIYVMKNNLDESRVGISVSKKVGKANVRNKVKRRIRESYRLLVDEKIKTGYDIVFIARIPSSTCEYKDIEKSVTYLCKKLNVVNKL